MDSVPMGCTNPYSDIYCKRQPGGCAIVVYPQGSPPLRSGDGQGRTGADRDTGHTQNAAKNCPGYQAKRPLTAPSASTPGTPRNMCLEELVKFRRLHPLTLLGQQPK